jgi:cobalt-precorrin 5A hydrolase
MPLHFLPQEALEAVADKAQTRSPRVEALFGVPSVAETAALAGAGPGAVLILPRIARDDVTCAIAWAPLMRETAA